MIDLRLTTAEAIALHLFLSNRVLMVSEDIPESVKNELAVFSVKQPELFRSEEKLAAELDNMLQAQRLMMQCDRPSPKSPV